MVILSVLGPSKYTLLKREILGVLTPSTVTCSKKRPTQPLENRVDLNYPYIWSIINAFPLIAWTFLTANRQNRVLSPREVAERVKVRAPTSFECHGKAGNKKTNQEWKSRSSEKSLELKKTEEISISLQSYDPINFWNSNLFEPSLEITLRDVIHCGPYFLKWCCFNSWSGFKTVLKILKRK